MAHKEVQEVIFSRGEVYLAFTAQDLARGGVELEVAKLENLAVGHVIFVATTPILAAQNSADARN